LAEGAVIWRGERHCPPRVFCIGKNYAEHVKELGDESDDELVVFMKPAESITDRLRSEAGEPLHYEGEITFLLEGGELTGVGFGFDLTKRKLQRHLKDRGLPWELSKAFGGSALFSKLVALEVPVDSLEVVLEKDGKLIQHGKVPQMIHQPAAILKGLKAFQDLKDGDLVMTGTPAGVGALESGSTYVGRILSEGKELISAEWVCF
jgi:2-keto-4-pentenoate hydratase/2-oxohepta-3-ene-1,7-dioic acid hydratase in catechol pathway